MARKMNVEREIDGVLFRVSQLPFPKARSVALRLAKVMGPVLEAIPTLQGGPQAILSAIPKAIDSLSEKALEALEDDLAEGCSFSTDGGKKWPLMSNEAARHGLFEGSFVLYAKWLAFAVEVNFADFFVAFAAPPAPDPEGETQGSGST